MTRPQESARAPGLQQQAPRMDSIPCAGRTSAGSGERILVEQSGQTELAGQRSAGLAFGHCRAWRRTDGTAALPLAAYIASRHCAGWCAHQCPSRCPRWPSDHVVPTSRATGPASSARADRGDIFVSGAERSRIRRHDARRDSPGAARREATARMAINWIAGRMARGCRDVFGNRRDSRNTIDAEPFAQSTVELAMRRPVRDR